MDPVLPRAVPQLRRERRRQALRALPHHGCRHGHRRQVDVGPRTRRVQSDPVLLRDGWLPRIRLPHLAHPVGRWFPHGGRPGAPSPPPRPPPPFWGAGGLPPGVPPPCPPP